MDGGSHTRPTTPSDPLLTCAVAPKGAQSVVGTDDAAPHLALAVVTLLGDRAWSLPGWLDRLLPNISLEGHLVQGLDEKVAEEERVKVPA